MFEIKNYREVICHENKVDEILKEKLTGGLKIDIKNLINFYDSCYMSGNLHFDGIFLSKAYKVLHEKVQRSYCFMRRKSDAKKS